MGKGNGGNPCGPAYSRIMLPWSTKTAGLSPAVHSKSIAHFNCIMLTIFHGLNGVSGVILLSLL